MSVITLLTDFGTKDEYVGVMKGVILSVNPGARIVDISHAVDPQDLLQTAFLIDAAWPYFPEGTVHVLVVDPGVGSQRAIVAIRKSGHMFLAPDNGVLTCLLEANDMEKAVRIDNAAFFLDPVSGTFHGRDIFAPVAGHLSSGRAMRDVGTAIDPRYLVRLSIAKPKANRHNEICGMVLSVDRFGNLITNIHQNQVKPLLDASAEMAPEIRVGDKTIVGIHLSYHQAAAGEPVAIIGSRRYLEIAVNLGNAAEYFNARKGDSVHVRLPDRSP